MRNRKQTPRYAPPQAYEVTITIVDRLSGDREIITGRTAGPRGFMKLARQARLPYGGEVYYFAPEAGKCREKI